MIAIKPRYWTWTVGNEHRMLDDDPPREGTYDPGSLMALYSIDQIEKLKAV